MLGTTSNFFFVGKFNGETVKPLHEPTDQIPYIPYGSREYRDEKPKPIVSREWLFENTIELADKECWVLTSKARNKVQTISAVRRWVYKEFGGKVGYCSGKIVQHCSNDMCVNFAHFTIER